MHRALLALGLLLLPLTVGAVDEPRLQAVTPATGPSTGGTVVQLTGVNFNLLPPGTLGVIFGASAATDVHVVSPTVISAVTPAHNADSVLVRLSINGVIAGRYGRRTFRYASAGPTTTTTTTTPTTTLMGSTTTTTIPCGGCADGDPCTVDACASSTCQHTPASTLDDLVGQASQCAGQSVPARVGERFILGCDLVREGRGSSNLQMAHRRFRSAVRVYARAIRVARRAARRSQLTPGCAEGLNGLLDTARVRAKALRGS